MGHMMFALTNAYYAMNSLITNAAELMASNTPAADLKNSRE